MRARLGGVLAVLWVLAGCSGGPDKVLESSALSAAPASAASSSVSMLPVGCDGGGVFPSMVGLPHGAPGTSLKVAAPDGAGQYQVTVRLVEEVQHPDLPLTSPNEVVVVPVAIKVVDGSLPALDGSAFGAFDEDGVRCLTPEDPIGYIPLVSKGLSAGESVSGDIPVQALRGSRVFTFVFYLEGSPVASWR